MDTDGRYIVASSACKRARSLKQHNTIDIGQTVAALVSRGYYKPKSLALLRAPFWYHKFTAQTRNMRTLVVEYKRERVYSIRPKMAKCQLLLEDMIRYYPEYPQALVKHRISLCSSQI